MNKKEDLRVVKTKAKIKKTFIELSNSKTFDQISIKEICEIAGITRKTFYNNFKDKYELLLALIKENSLPWFKQILNKIEFSKTNSDIKDIVTLLIHSIAEISFINKKKLSVLNFYENNACYEMVQTIAIKEMIGFFNKVSSHYNLKGWGDIPYMARFIICGLLGCLTDWAKKPNSTKEDIILQINNISNNLFYANAYLKRID